MSLADLDALLNTPANQKPKRASSRRKKRTSQKSARSAENERRLRMVEQAVERAREWRLSAEPYETRIFIQHTRCTSCRTEDETTISPPMIAYKDRLGRVHAQRTDLIPRDLPIAFHRTHLTVPACHHCAAMCCRAADPNGHQLEINFNKQARSMRRALVRIQDTPQYTLLTFIAGSAHEITDDIL